jgi:hypothetical protein
MMRIAFSIAAGALGLALFSLPASAAPMTDRGVAPPNAIEQAAQGCGRGWARNARGACRPVFHGPRWGHPRPGVRTQMYRDQPEGCERFPSPTGRGTVRRCR